MAGPRSLVKLTVVGCAPAYTSRPGRVSSCYLVEHGQTSVVLDFGQGAFSELSRYRAPDTVTGVLISHLHADHCVDLIPLRHFVKFERGGRGPALYGPAELRSRIGWFQADPDFLAGFDGGPIDDGQFTIGELQVEARRVTHIPDSFAFRVSPSEGSGPGLVYSGDCAVWQDLLPLVKPADTLLSEAARGAGREEGGPHLTSVEAASAASAGGASRLFLTHVLDRHDEGEALHAARAVFPVAEFAQPGMTVDIR